VKRVVLLVAIALSLAATAAVACGPWFPNTYLAGGDETQMLVMPEGDFYHELEAIAATEKDPGVDHDNHDAPKEWPSDLYWQRTSAADRKDLAEALTRAGLAAKSREAILAEYVAMRQAMKLATDGSTADTNYDAEHRPVPGRFDLAPHDATLQKLPAEFALYARGAAAYKGGDAKAAVAHWQAVLALPPADRHYRSTWAAFMIGKALLPTDPAKARTWFEKARALADEGCADSLHVTEAALSWQGRAEYDLRLYEQAIRHYYQLFRKSRFPESLDGYTSLGRTCRKVFDDPQSRLETLAADPLCRRILTAWALSRPDHEQNGPDGPRWLAAVEAAAKVSPKDSAVGADRLAWAAYRAGQMGAAARWAALADPKAPYAQWVRSKLLLRAGKIDEALGVLRGLVAAFPAEDVWPDYANLFEEFRAAEAVRSEVGVLLLGRRDYAAALEMLARGRFWDDAAYVAERVLTVNELSDFVAGHAHDVNMMRPPKAGEGEVPGPSVLDRLRHLLARRLARQGDWAKALPLWPAKVRPDAERYVATLAMANDAKRPDRERAVALYRAARLARTRGLCLFGTELDPDWASVDGNYDLGNAFAKRGVDTQLDQEVDYQAVAIKEPAALVAALGPTGDERARVTRSAPTPNTRFHYRTTAAELMWQCGERLPDNDPLLARALWEGGVYLKDRDPKAADKFYKALVNRCRKLPIGPEADRLRWFPKEPPPLPAGVVVPDA
jgi:tetratricopeptide (TPR) repeat protein